MDADEIYDACLPILNDSTIEEEDRTEKLEEFVRAESNLSGKPLETAVLDILWRFRNHGVPSSSPSITIRKSASPAPWQVSRSSTPAASPRSTTASPAPGSLSAKRPGIFRVKSSTAGSPFSSPRPSPRLQVASPQIPHSPSLNTYEVSNETTGATPDIYGDFGSDNVDWLVSDDGTSNTSSVYAGDGTQVDMAEMSPYDLLRSVLRDERSDDEIEKVLEANGYDLSAAIASLVDGQHGDGSQLAGTGSSPEKTYLVGKSMAAAPRPLTPSGQAKSSVVCRYWLQTGQCLRADCRFSHDLSNHVCKYWLQGNCLAGDSCIFSHDPSSLVGNLSLNNSSYAATPPVDMAYSGYEIQDYSSFPTLGSSQPASPGVDSSLKNIYGSQDAVAPPPGFSTRPALAPEFIPSRPQSRPTSRRQSPAPRAQQSSGIAVDDGEAFPALGAATVRPSRKHHGKRGHGHGHREKENNNPSSLADVVRSAPAPQSPRKTLRSRGGYFAVRDNTSAALAIPAPEHIPWLETGDRANKAYLKARQEAIRHGSARNKFLQSAAQAWHRNDVRAAKTLSLRGQSENDLMREAHRAAAKALYDDRNRHLGSSSSSTTAHHGSTTTRETFIDLHGLHPAEAVSYVADALATQRRSLPGGGGVTSALHREDDDDDGLESKARYLYAIVGTGHHSRGGKDKVGKAVRSYLSECGYAFREFGVPGDKAFAPTAGSGSGSGSGVSGGGGAAAGGGILGIDISSGDSSSSAAAAAAAAASSGLAGDDDGGGHGGGSKSALQHGKVRILKAEDVERGR